MAVNICPLRDRVLVKRLESDEEQVRGGIIIPDPAKVAKTALLNATSIAGLMLTTEALVSEIKETEGGNGGGGIGGMGEGMGGMY